MPAGDIPGCGKKYFPNTLHTTFLSTVLRIIYLSYWFTGVPRNACTPKGARIRISCMSIMKISIGRWETNMIKWTKFLHSYHLLVLVPAIRRILFYRNGFLFTRHYWWAREVLYGEHWHLYLTGNGSLLFHSAMFCSLHWIWYIFMLAGILK